MLFANLLHFLLIGILGEKFLSYLCTKNRFTVHEQLIYFFLISWTVNFMRRLLSLPLTARKQSLPPVSWYINMF